MYHLKQRAAPDQVLKFVAIDYLLVGARRVEQTGRNSATHGGTMTDHGHQWYDARPPSDQQKGTAHVRLPDEVSSDGTAQLQLVTGAEFIREVGRHLPIIEPFDGQRHARVLLGW